MTLPQTKAPHQGTASASGSARPGAARGARRLSTPTHFACGHEKSPENAYGDGARMRCRTCAKVLAAKWRAENAEHRARYDQRTKKRKVRLDAAYRRQHRLAFQLYFLIRRLAIADGLWPRRGESTDERGAA